MGRGLLSLLLFACCLSVAVQVSKTSSDDAAGSKTAQSEADPRSQRNADAPDSIAAVIDNPVNGTEGVNGATFVRVSEWEGQPSKNIDKEGERQERVVLNNNTFVRLSMSLLINKDH